MFSTCILNGVADQSVTRDGQDDDVPSHPATPSKKNRSAGSRTSPKKRPVMFVLACYVTFWIMSVVTFL